MNFFEAIENYKKIDFNSLSIEELKNIQTNLEKKLNQYIEKKDFSVCDAKIVDKNENLKNLLEVLRKLNSVEYKISSNYNERIVISTLGNLGENYFLSKLEPYGIITNNLPPNSPFTLDMRQENGNKFIDSKFRLSKSFYTKDKVTLYKKEFEGYTDAVCEGKYTHFGKILETNVEDIIVAFIFNYGFNAGEVYVSIKDILNDSSMYYYDKKNNWYDIDISKCFDFNTLINKI
jgi:hypothetical protein